MRSDNMLLLHGNNRYHAKEHEYQGTDIVAENTYRAELGLHLYGRSEQDGIPSPESPIPIDSIGDSGSVDVVVSDNNGNSQTLTINTPNGLCGIPVDTGGNYTDSAGQQWICDEIDFERGVFVQRVKKSDVPNNVVWNIQQQKGGYALGYKSVFSDGQTTRDHPTSYPQWLSNLGRSSPSWTNSFSYGRSGVFWIVPYANDGTLTSDDINNWLTEHSMTVVYPLITSIETPLTAEQLAAYKAIKSYPHYTHIESEAEMKIKLKEY